MKPRAPLPGAHEQYPLVPQIYEPVSDPARIRTRLGRVRELMADRRWRTLAEIANALGVGHSATSGLSARLRDLRKEKFGAFVVLRRRRVGRIYEYSVRQGPRSTGEVQG